jgi:hypothetical protein
MNTGLLYRAIKMTVYVILCRILLPDCPSRVVASDRKPVDIIKSSKQVFSSFDQ